MHSDDRTLLIRFASTLPKGSDERRTILAGLRRKTAFSEANFWAFVDGTGWGRKTTDYNAIKENLMSRLDADSAAKMRDILDRKKMELSKAVRDHEEDTGEELEAGGDTRDDLFSHIVGMGLREFRKNEADPSLIIERYENGDYRESFSYAIPWRSDYRKQRDTGPQSGDLFKDGDRVYLSDLPSSMAKGYRDAAKRMGAAGQKALAAYAAFEAAMMDAKQAKKDAAKIQRVMVRYLDKNSPEGIDGEDLLYVRSPYVYTGSGQSPDEIAQAYIDGAKELLKAK